MSSYSQDWREKPAGYYADYQIKVDHNRRVEQERIFNRLVEDELARMGYSPEEIPTDEDIERAEARAEDRFWF